MQISKELADALLKESPSFRKFVLAQAFDHGDRSLQGLAQIAIDAYEKALADPNKTPTVAAIKAVRENSIEYIREIMSDDADALFYDNKVGLKWAKKFVQDVCKF